jgi:dihydrofolate reductase
MRKLKLIEHISLDGIIQAGADTDGGFHYGDWSAPYRTPEGLAMILPEWGERFDLLLGRRTYDLWTGFWPTAPRSPMADRLNAATKYVVTHRPQTLQWGPAEGLGSDYVTALRAIKAKDGPDMVLSGSSTLTSALIENGLADEILLLVNPILLGQGKQFFRGGTPARAFELKSSRTTKTGIVANSYTFVGALKS